MYMCVWHAGSIIVTSSERSSEEWAMVKWSVLHIVHNSTRLQACLSLTWELAGVCISYFSHQSSVTSLTIMVILAFWISICVSYTVRIKNNTQAKAFHNCSTSTFTHVDNYVYFDTYANKCSWQFFFHFLKTHQQNTSYMQVGGVGEPLWMGLEFSIHGGTCSLLM